MSDVEVVDAEVVEGGEVPVPDQRVEQMQLLAQGLFQIAQLVYEFDARLQNLEQAHDALFEAIYGSQEEGEAGPQIPATEVK
jgi:hypothetical protein